MPRGFLYLSLGSSWFSKAKVGGCGLAKCLWRSSVGTERCHSLLLPSGLGRVLCCPVLRVAVEQGEPLWSAVTQCSGRQFQPCFSEVRVQESCGILAGFQLLVSCCVTGRSAAELWYCRGSPFLRALGLGLLPLQLQPQKHLLHAPAALLTGAWEQELLLQGRLCPGEAAGVERFLQPHRSCCPPSLWALCHTALD